MYVGGGCIDVIRYLLCIFLLNGFLDLKDYAALVSMYRHFRGFMDFGDGIVDYHSMITDWLVSNCNGYG